MIQNTEGRVVLILEAVCSNQVVLFPGLVHVSLTADPPRGRRLPAGGTEPPAAEGPL